MRELISLLEKITGKKVLLENTESNFSNKFSEFIEHPWLSDVEIEFIELISVNKQKILDNPEKGKSYIKRAKEINDVQLSFRASDRFMFSLDNLIDLQETDFLEEDSEVLSARRLGAKKALITKGFDDWTIEQYALAYFLVKYGKRYLPEPYRTMPIHLIADSAEVKFSTLQMNSENIRYLLKGDSTLQSTSPKSEGYVQEFETMNKDNIMFLVMKAFNTVKSKNFYKNNPDMENKVSVKDLTPAQKDHINKIRADKGLKPLGENRIINLNKYL